jgi:hypothetical protein
MEREILLNVSGWIKSPKKHIRWIVTETSEARHFMNFSFYKRGNACAVNCVNKLHVFILLCESKSATLG